MKSFSCEYSPKTNNLTFYYEGESVEGAERILGYYVDDLREKLRSRETKETAEAIESMKQEVRVTSDTLLQQQLYGLIANQMQQLKLAQVQADFAFSVLEPPVAPDRKYSPKRLLDSAIVAALAVIVACMWIIFKKRPE